MLRRSLNSVEVRFFKADYRGILAKLKEYAEKLVEERGVRAVILVGSLARGDFTAFSDADVVVVSDQEPRRLIDRISKYIDPSLPIDVEPRVYTSAELLRMSRERSKLVEEIIKYGRLLAGDPQILDAIKRVFGGSS